jgi:hypothetical protein
MWIVLNSDETALLDKQDPSTASDGGFQSMMVRFQKGLRRGTSELKLSDDDREQIARYAFDFKNGGWQSRLIGIFGRTLGEKLGRDT